MKMHIKIQLQVSAAYIYIRYDGKLEEDFTSQTNIRHDACERRLECVTVSPFMAMIYGFRHMQTLNADGSSGAAMFAVKFLRLRQQQNVASPFIAKLMYSRLPQANKWKSIHCRAALCELPSTSTVTADIIAVSAVIRDSQTGYELLLLWIESRLWVRASEMSAAPFLSPFAHSPVQRQRRFLLRNKLSAKKQHGCHLQEQKLSKYTFFVKLMFAMKWSLFAASECFVHTPHSSVSYYAMAQSTGSSSMHFIYIHIVCLCVCEEIAAMRLRKIE